MPARRPVARPGQSLVEYVLIIGVVGLLLIPGLSFLQQAQGAFFGRQQAALSSDFPTPAPAATPTASPYLLPTSAADCKNGGWHSYVVPEGSFKNQGDCESWVQTNGKNAPALTPAPTATPTPAVAYTLPMSTDDCKNGGWRTFVTPAGTFKNQGDCQSWVVTNGRNAPANP